MPRTRNLMNADYDVMLFFSLRIYYWRSTLINLEMKAPEDIQLAIATVSELMSRTFASNNELHDRVQWPLFLVGIETKDVNLRRDIGRQLSKRPRDLLEKIAMIQDTIGMRMKMSKVRSLLAGTDEVVHSGFMMEI